MIGATSDNSLYLPTLFDRHQTATGDPRTAEIARRYFAGQRWREIESATGISRVMGWKRLKRAGIACDRRRGMEQVTCERCGKSFDRPAWHAVRPIHTYCSHRCYRAWMREQGHAYRSYRPGQRVARRVVGAVFPLQPGYVVHHHDGDNRHNALANLAVFATHSEHMSFHRGGDGQPIWDGAVAAVRGFRCTAAP